MPYACTWSSAREYAAHGRLEKWVHAYLLSDGHNKEFSDGLKLFDRYFLGPAVMPLKLFRRVRELEEVIQREKDMPPLIAHYFVGEDSADGEFELNDGNHRLEAYSRLGIGEYAVIVWITEKNEYDLFLSKYSGYLKR
jgi:hypothetical protein